MKLNMSENVVRKFENFPSLGKEKIRKISKSAVEKMRFLTPIVRRKFVGGCTSPGGETCVNRALHDRILAYRRWGQCS